jgi:hypothetical protein
VFSVLLRRAATGASIATYSANPASDINTWKTVAGLMAEGKNVYTERAAGDDPRARFCKGPNAACYNWPPAWAWVVFGLDQLASPIHAGTMRDSVSL